MRYLTTIVLMICMLGTTFGSYIIMMDYTLNKKYISANLCENKERPRVKCEGRCYLCKKINNENKKDAGIPGHRANFKFETPVMSKPGCPSLSASFIKLPGRPHYQDKTCSLSGPSFFHPPRI